MRIAPLTRREYQSARALVGQMRKEAARLRRDTDDRSTLPALYERHADTLAEAAREYESRGLLARLIPQPRATARDRRLREWIEEVLADLDYRLGVLDARSGADGPSVDPSGGGAGGR